MAFPATRSAPLAIPTPSQKTYPASTITALPSLSSSVSSYDSLILDDDDESTGTTAIPIDVPSTLSLATQLREAQALIRRLQQSLSQETHAHERTKQSLEDVEERNEQLRAHFMQPDPERDDDLMLRAETLAMGYKVVRADMLRETVEAERDEAVRKGWELEGRVRGLEETERGLRREILGLNYKLKLERGGFCM